VILCHRCIYEIHFRPISSLDLPQEPPAVIESHRVPAYWPSNTGNDSILVVQNLVIKYAPDLPAVLHDVSFSLKAGERVGLLGRTGSFLIWIRTLV
jgi:ABC-type multidrug transport system fused ATPase/permease subunit